MEKLCYPFEEKCNITAYFDVVYTVDGVKIRHAGLDFSTAGIRKAGKKKIYAPCDGVMTRSGKNRYASGYYLALYSKTLNKTFQFWHVGEYFPVAEGKSVKKGDVIGWLGLSGQYKEHTHFQVNNGNYVWGSWNSKVQDPMPYYKAMVLKSELISNEEKMNAELQKKYDDLMKAMVIKDNELGTLKANVTRLEVQVAELTNKQAGMQNDIDKAEARATTAEKAQKKAEEALTAQLVNNEKLEMRLKGFTENDNIPNLIFRIVYKLLHKT